MNEEKLQIKLDYETKLELNKQNTMLQSELTHAKGMLKTVGLEEPPTAMLVDVGDTPTGVTNANLLHRASPPASVSIISVTSLTSSATPMADRNPILAYGYDPLQATKLDTCVQQVSLSITLPIQSTSLTQTLTRNSSYSADKVQMLRPAQTNLPHAGSPLHTDIHLQQSNHKGTDSQPVVSINYAPPSRTIANTSLAGQVPVAGLSTAMSVQPLTNNETGLMSRSGQQTAPVASDATLCTHTSTTDSGKFESCDRVQSPVGLLTSGAPTAQALSTSGPVLSQPVVIVKQFQKPKPYLGQTSHKSFREHFERVAKANA